MEREHAPELTELGQASVETQGPNGPRFDITGPAPQVGIDDED